MILEIIAYAALLYLFLFTVKLFLALGSFPAAATAYSRVMTGKRFDLYATAITFALLPVVLFFNLIPTLKSEGWRFFLTYTNTCTIRQVLKAVREAQRAEAAEVH